MNVIFVPKIGGRGNTLRLNGRLLMIVCVGLMIAMIGLAAGGYYLGQVGGGGQYLSSSQIVSDFNDDMVLQREEISRARRNASESLDALAMRMGQLQAHVIRLDALGSRLTEIAKLDSGEFDFSAVPAQGGPVSYATRETFTVPDFVEGLNKLSFQIENRAQQLDLLETLMMSQDLEQQVVPQGRPIKKGWLSSYFGMRADPFTGKQERHKGLDFAGKLGGDVVAVAAGVVTWASDRYGYGNLVEINHGNGYSTRYGHAQEVLVKLGQTIKKGDTIALIGSSGRSTGPHVHFEVIKNGKTVDPINYLH